MTMVNAAFYKTLLSAGLNEIAAGEAAAAVTHRPFTEVDAAIVRQTFLCMGVDLPTADAAVKSLQDPGQ
jgi:hypothetical protein